MSERTKEDKSRVFFCEIFRPNALGLLPTAHQLVTLVLASTKELEEKYGCLTNKLISCWSCACSSLGKDVTIPLVKPGIGTRSWGITTSFSGNSRANVHQAVTKDLTSSWKFSGSCVLTLQTIRWFFLINWQFNIYFVFWSASWKNHRFLKEVPMAVSRLQISYLFIASISISNILKECELEPDYVLISWFLGETLRSGALFQKFMDSLVSWPSRFHDFFPTLTALRSALKSLFLNFSFFQDFRFAEPWQGITELAVRV